MFQRSDEEISSDISDDNDTEVSIAHSGKWYKWWQWYRS